MLRQHRQRRPGDDGEAEEEEGEGGEDAALAAAVRSGRVGAAAAVEACVLALGDAIAPAVPALLFPVLAAMNDPPVDILQSTF